SVGLAAVPLKDNCERPNKFTRISGPDRVPGGVVSTALFSAHVTTCEFTSISVSLEKSIPGGFDAIFVQTVSIRGLAEDAVDSAALKVKTGTGGALSADSGIPASPNEMIWGIWMFDAPASPYVPGRGYTSVDGGEAVSFIEFKNVAEAVAQTPTAT